VARARTPAPALPPTRRTPAPRPARPHDAGPQPARAGFVLYVGLQGEGGEGDPAGLDARHAADLAEVAEALRDLARDLLPTAETFTALSLVPGTAGPDDVQDLRARLSALRPLPEPPGDDAGADPHAGAGGGASAAGPGEPPAIAASA
jgi:hypothetical protein